MQAFTGRDVLGFSWEEQDSGESTLEMEDLNEQRCSYERRWRCMSRGKRVENEWKTSEKQQK